MPLIDPEQVNKIFIDSLFNDGEDTAGHIPSEGITITIGFHPARLESHRDEVREMLSNLPEQFQQSKSGGWTFLNAYQDREGNQWANFHRRMEELFLMGNALGLSKWQLPKDMWAVLPRGMPYVVVLDEVKQEA